MQDMGVFILWWVSFNSISRVCLLGFAAVMWWVKDEVLAWEPSVVTYTVAMLLLSLFFAWGIRRHKFVSDYIAYESIMWKQILQEISHKSPGNDSTCSCHRFWGYKTIQIVILLINESGVSSQVSTIDKIPGPKAYPVVGNTLQVVVDARGNS